MKILATLIFVTAVLLALHSPAKAQPSGYCCYGQEQSKHEAEVQQYCLDVAVNYFRAVNLRRQGHTRREIRDLLD